MKLAQKLRELKEKQEEVAQYIDEMITKYGQVAVEEVLLAPEDKITEDARNFLGIPVEGEAHHSWRHESVKQRPLTDLRPYFDKLWENGVKAVTWTQYTPYFNDGDTCEFNVHEPSFTSNEKIAECWLENLGDYEDENGDYVDASHYEYERPWGSYSHPDGLTKEQLDLPVDSYEFEYAMRDAFGDHTQVVVTPDRVVQFDYSHE